MDLYPAIDLRGGRCVRLVQGDYGRETVYGDDPVTVAQAFAAAGAPWIHVVDLDAALSGQAINTGLIGAVAAAVDVPVQSGGGVRGVEAADRLIDAGVARFVIGTAAITEAGLVEKLGARHPGRVAVGLDHRRGPDGRPELALRGWTEGSGRDLFAVLDQMETAGASALVVTDISRDGMLAGPDLEGLGQVLAATSLPVIASGGVAEAADLGALAALEVDGRRLAGAIVGTAIYEGRFTVEEGLAACAR